MPCAPGSNGSIIVAFTGCDANIGKGGTFAREEVIGQMEL